MTSFRKIFFSGIIWKAVFYFTSFFLNLLLANYLGAAGSKPLFYLLNSVSIIIFLLSFGVDSAINYFNARKEIAFNKLLSIAILWTIAAVLLFAVLFPLLEKIGLLPRVAPLPVILLFVAGAFLTSNLTSLYLSSNDNVTPNIIPAVINSLLIVLIALQFSPTKVFPTSNSLFETYLVSAFITAILLLLFIFRKTKSSAGEERPLISKKFIQYSSAIFVANVFITLLVRSDIWILNYFVSDADLGNYLQTGKFLQLVLIIPTLASFTLFPLIIQNIDANTEIEKKILKLVNSYIYLSLLICIAIAAVGYWLFPLLYGPTFSKMYITFLWLIPGAVAFAATYPLTPFFSAKNLNSVITRNSLFAIVVMVLADLILIPRFSIYGAAIGSSLAYTTYFLLSLHNFKKLHSFSMGSLFHYGKFYNELLVILQRTGK